MKTTIDLEEFRDAYEATLNNATKWVIFTLIGLGILQSAFSSVWHIQGIFKDAPAMGIVMIACIVLGNLISLQYINKKLTEVNKEKD